MYNQPSLKNFTIVEKLGKGSFSSVFKVQRLDDNMYYAMKKVKIGEMRQKQKQNALNQVRILASLNHQNIINYKQSIFDQSSQTLCVVMELADAGDIQKKINKHIQQHSHFNQTQIWRAFLQMSKGLKALHQINILHRDLKCANVFCTQDGKYKLGDLNVSKVAKRGMAKTQTGTPYYTSPQVWKDKPYDSKCDIWSLGCVIYQMAALKPPFRASNLKELYNKIQRGIFQRIPIFYSQDLQNIINMCLKVNPLSRPSASEILENPKVLKNIPSSQLYKENQQNQHNNLLKTIQVPKNLKSLKQALPKSKYASENESQLRAISQRRYDRVNSAQSLSKNPTQIPRVITTPKVNNSNNQNQIKYSLMRKIPIQNNQYQPQQRSQNRQITKLPTRISRNNSVDSLRKKSQSKQYSREKVKNCMEQISNRCKQIQERVQNLINKKGQNKSAISPMPIIPQRKGGAMFLPRVNSRERVMSANRQYQNMIKQHSQEKAINKQQSFGRQYRQEQKQPISQQKSKQLQKNKSLERPNSGSRKKYAYVPPPKIR